MSNMARSRIGPELADPYEGSDLRVVYLLGAGATQGCVSFRGSTERVVMPGLVDELISSMRNLLYENPEYETHKALRRLVNEVIQDDTDFEQLITFLGDARSATHQQFSAGLRKVFSTVLRGRLDDVEDELGDRRSDLYAALIDMHEVPGVGEDLGGFLTLNYDGFLEHAIETHAGRTVDYGISLRPRERERRPIRVLKLHGSFSWGDEWPVGGGSYHEHELWIPPGIRKAKTDYPFNLIWGLAREMLDCDVLRIIGCNLGPNDWDLVSMLFTTMHAHASNGPYRIEVVAGPKTAGHIAKMFPYLEVLSILELPDIGAQVVGENTGGPPVEFAHLSLAKQKEVACNAQTKIGNPFEYWLRLKGETLNVDLDTIETPAGLFERFVDGVG